MTTDLPEGTRATQRFAEFKDIIEPAPEEPEPTRSAKAAKAVTSAVRSYSAKNPGILHFVLGLLAGSVLTILGGLIR